MQCTCSLSWLGCCRYDVKTEKRAFHPASNGILAPNMTLCYIVGTECTHMAPTSKSKFEDLTRPALTWLIATLPFLCHGILPTRLHYDLRVLHITFFVRRPVWSKECRCHPHTVSTSSISAHRLPFINRTCLLKPVLEPKLQVRPITVHGSVYG